jgi:hypothetical protein
MIGRVLLTLKTEWSDGTTALLFEPVELLERLAALTPRPRINLVLHPGVLASHSRWRARAVAYGAGHLCPPRPRRGGRVRHGRVARPAERAVVRRRAGGERRGASRPRPHDRGRPRRASVIYAGGESRPGHHRERGAAPTSGGTKVVVAGADAARVRGGRVGLYSVWRPHARGGYHRGPRRHPEDSHPPRAPDRGVGAPAAAVRPVRLELSPSTSARADARGVSARRCLATDHRPVGFPTAAPAHGRDHCGHPGRPIVRCVVTEQAKTLRTSEMGVSVSLRGKGPSSRLSAGFGLEIACAALKHGDAVVAAARKPGEGYRRCVGSRVADRRRTI